MNFNISVQTGPADVGVPAPVHPVWDVVIGNAAGEKVGKAAYGLSPRLDRVYVHRLEIQEHMRRRGYGLAFLLILHCHYRLPMVPIVETRNAGPFWNAVRRLAVDGLAVLSGMSRADLPDEQIRWRRQQAGVIDATRPSTGGRDAGDP